MTYPPPGAVDLEPLVARRATDLFQQQMLATSVRTDRRFAMLTAIEWAAGIAFAVWISPQAWTGQYSKIHFHVWIAIFLGGTIASLPILYVFLYPGRVLTRHVVAASQMLLAGLLVHLTAGRIETHFLFFGLLAFLAFYRDSRVLLTATCVTGTDHLLRGIFWPQSIYGVLYASPWRTAEHVGWVLFEVMFLVDFIRQSRAESYAVAVRHAQLEGVNDHVFAEVEARTKDLRAQIAERERAEKERDKMEVDLRHSQKLESIGHLAAGIAHEINTPMQYVKDNLRFLDTAFEDFRGLLKNYDDLLNSAPKGMLASELRLQTAAVVKQADAEYLMTEIPEATRHAREGVDRVAKLVLAMKEFSHPGSREKTLVNLNKAIENTITIAQNEWKYVADLETDLDETLPPLSCLSSELSQVVLNLLVNASHTIAEAKGKNEARGKITVRTRNRGAWAEIAIQDTGTGIPEKVRDRVFDPFFTTKEVGRGTGQGLAICHSIVVTKHNGTIHFETEMGKGTTFFIRLPYEGAALPAAAVSA